MLHLCGLPVKFWFKRGDHADCKIYIFCFTSAEHPCNYFFLNFPSRFLMSLNLPRFYGQFKILNLVAPQYLTWRGLTLPKNTRVMSSSKPQLPPEQLNIIRD
jgi:hypothetical protein